jgi:hypothetical protein
MRITQQQLRRIIQEEVTKMMKEGPRRSGRHGTDWDYSSYGGRSDYPRGGEDEGGDEDDDKKKKGKKLDPDNWWGAIGPDDDDY